MEEKYRLLAVLIVLCLLAGCMTYGVPEKQSDEDCLVIVKTKVENRTEYDVARNYYFFVTGQDEGYDVSEAPVGYLYIKVMNDSTRIEYIDTSVQEKGFKGESNRMEFNLTLPYEPGQVLIADFVFVQTISKTAQNTVTSMIDFVPLTDKEHETITNRIMTAKAFESWRS